MTAKGYYDLSTYKFKSVSSFSLIFTADNAQVESSAHLQRLINGCVRLPMPSSEERKEHRNLFVARWIQAPGYAHSLFISFFNREEMRSQCVTVIRAFIQSFGDTPPSNRLLHTFCRSFTQLCSTEFPLKLATKPVESESFLSSLLHSELSAIFIERLPPKSELRESLTLALNSAVTSVFPSRSPVLQGNSSEDVTLQSLMAKASDKLPRSALAQLCFTVMSDVIQE